MCQALKDLIQDGKEEGRAEERINTERERARAEVECQRADAECQRADAECQRAEAECQRADKAEAELRRLREQLAQQHKKK